MLPAQKIAKLVSDGELGVNGGEDIKIGSASLDVKLGNLINRYKIENHTLGDHIDDSSFSQEEYKEHILKPNESIIISIKESFDMPNSVSALLIPRGSIIKLGISFPVNFINAGYKGKMSILLQNSSNMNIKLVPNIYIGQVVFFDLKENSNNPYREDDKYYDENSDKSKIDLDSYVEEVTKKAFPSLYK